MSMNVRVSPGSGSFSFDVVSVYPQPESACLLLVDDDPEVLGSLRRTLTDKTWDIVAVRDPQAALHEFDSRRVDIVLSDMNMDAMSGATLLGAVQQRHPDVVRIIMSGHTDPKAVLRAVPFAHQFLAKPVDTDVLRWTLRRACGLRKLLTSEAVRAAVGASNEMPAAPATYLKLKQLLRDPQVGLAELAAVVERDVGVSARILQLVSSAFFGMPRRVTTVTAAVKYLGIDTLRTLVLAIEIVRMFRDAGNLPGFSLDVLQRHSFITAKLARGFAEDAFADDAFVAGMLHSIGQLILAERIPGRYSEVLERVRAEKRPLKEVERQVIGATHAEVGAYLLGLWGLPQRIVEAVMHYDEPWRLDGTRLGLAGSVYLGSALAERPEAPLVHKTLAVPPGHLNGDYLERIGMMEKLPTLRSLARRAVL
jgi:HD-like signal output (HDOD) protein